MVCEAQIRADLMAHIFGYATEKPGPEIEIYMMSHPELWPMSRLPLVRKRDDKPGYLSAGQPVVTMGLLFDGEPMKGLLPDDGTNLAYGSWEGLLADGWRVD